VPTTVRRRVAGVDGCKRGWVVALVPERDDEPTSVHVVASFADVLALRPVAIAVDMPIGLPDAGPRACDIATRARLGVRRSSVFPSPIRPMLDATSYAEALAIGRRVDGRGLSRQAFNLIPRIRDVDQHITQRMQAWIGEAHPELCFALLLGAPCAASKKTAEGRAERLAAITGAYPDAVERIAEPHLGAALDDVLDAYALTVTARRLNEGMVLRLGDGARDSTGLRQEVVL
jgi:predicted RNase H-like nuclease